MSKVTSQYPRDLPVRPSPQLCALRPELAGASGKITEVEGDKVVVAWEGHEKPYRVSFDLLEKGSQ